MDIRYIRVRDVSVPKIPDWAVITPESIPLAVPVTQGLITGQIGFPIVDVPGCVTARETDGNNNLIEDDENGNLILCDGTAPVFPTFDYSPNDLKPIIDKKPNIQLPPSTPPAENIANTDALSEGLNTGMNLPGPTTLPPASDPPSVNECPRPDDPPVGSKGKFGTARVSGYELNEDGQCITLWESQKPQDVAFTYLPPPPLVLTTGATAAVAVTSSVLIKPLSDYLLKVVKPLVKKTLKKVLPRLLKKKPKVLSLRERRLEQRSLRK